MRVAIWSFAHMHAASYAQVLTQRADVEFVGIADEDEGRGRAQAIKYGVPYYLRPDDLLGRAEAVVITSANADHKPMALRAAELGVHALVEKPIATTVADAQAMIDAFERRRLVLGTAFPCPFSPAFVALLDTVRKGQLGDILAVRSTNRGSMPGGFFIQLERSGGGAVIDHTVHVADLPRRLLGCEPARVYAEVGHGLFHQDWDDSGLLSITFANGVPATLDCSWSRPKSFPTWGDVTLRVIGERGNAYADLFGQHVAVYPSDPGPGRWIGWGSGLDGLLIGDFLDAVRDGRPPRSTGVDGLRALQVALAAYRSARSGEPVDV